MQIISHVYCQPALNKFSLYCLSAENVSDENFYELEQNQIVEMLTNQSCLFDFICKYSFEKSCFKKEHVDGDGQRDSLPSMDVDMSLLEIIDQESQSNSTDADESGISINEETVSSVNSINEETVSSVNSSCNYTLLSKNLENFC